MNKSLVLGKMKQIKEINPDRARNNQVVTKSLVLQNETIRTDAERITIMVKLLIIADDFTGALDSGVQLAASGAETRVITNIDYDFQKAADQSVQVLVLDAETRHLKPADAYNAVYTITKRAKESGISYIYKKTDSALRGNVGMELKAVLDASGEESLHFLPAFPVMNRTVKDGILYISGVPAAESVFGKDPFEPVVHSYIPDLLGTDMPVAVVSSLHTWENKKGILVYDAATDQSLTEAGSFLMEKGKLHIMAGCAGFAAALPKLLGLAGNGVPGIELAGNFIIACGSVNPITKSQMDYAEEHGFLRVRLRPEQKLYTSYYENGQGKQDLAFWKELCRQQDTCIFDTNDLPGENKTLEYAEKHNISLEELRVNISSTLGYVVKELVLSGINSTILITGGDCLTGFMKHLGCDEIMPICEMAPGTVLSQIEIGGRKLGILSKSGGFGDKTLFVDLAKTILEKKEKKIC